MLYRAHIQGALAGAAVMVAVIGGAYAAKSLVEGGAAVTTASNGAAAADQLVKAPVPFLGPYALHVKGAAQCGPGVKLMEQALTRTTPPIRKTKPANCIGKATVKQLVAFQKRHKITPSGIYGTRTHRALAHAYGPQMRAALVKIATARRDALRRSTILIVTSHAKLFEHRMIYCDAGSLAHCGSRGVWPSWPDVPRHTDCSGYVSWVLFQAGVPNPNGTGVGTTYSLINHGTPVPINGPLKVGDLIFYGNNTHVAIYIGHGLVSSHGKNYVDIYAYGYRGVYAVRRYF